MLCMVPLPLVEGRLENQPDTHKMQETDTHATFTFCLREVQRFVVNRLQGCSACNRAIKPGTNKNCYNEKTKEKCTN